MKITDIDKEIVTELVDNKAKMSETVAGDVGSSMGGGNGFLNGGPGTLSRAPGSKKKKRNKKTTN